MDADDLPVISRCSCTAARLTLLGKWSIVAYTKSHLSQWQKHEETAATCVPLYRAVPSRKTGVTLLRELFSLPSNEDRLSLVAVRVLVCSDFARWNGKMSEAK